MSRPLFVLAALLGGAGLAAAQQPGHARVSMPAESSPALMAPAGPVYPPRPLGSSPGRPAWSPARPAPRPPPRPARPTTVLGSTSPSSLPPAVTVDGSATEGSSVSLGDGGSHEDRAWITADYLLWFLQNAPSHTPLVTTGTSRSLAVFNQKRHEHPRRRSQL